MRAHATTGARTARARSGALRVCLALLVAASGCAAARPAILAQANPNPLVDQTKFALAPVSFAVPLRVGEKTEPEYLAANPDDVTKWADAKKSFNDTFARAIVTQDLWDPNAKYTVRAMVKSVGPGVYGVSGVFVQKPADVDVEVSIVDQHGNEIDKIGIHPSNTGISVEDRLGRCGRVAGAMTVDYLRTRMHRVD